MKLTHAYILAGGRSSRFGTDKARALWHGAPLILHHVPLLQRLGLQVTAIAATTNQYADLGLRTIADQHPGAGPLAGLEAALLDASQGASVDASIVLMPCDLLVLSSAWLTLLAQVCSKATPAAAFFTERWQPLPAVYSTALVPLVAEHLARGQLALWRLLEAAGAAQVPAPSDWPTQLQVNTPQELRTAQKKGLEPKLEA